ncbi:HTH domain-containing protein, partial [Treponema sp.]|uniref:HTH domain-containing protein n=1 Tax=Treponema sp. TaxID=166 RepID=UPI003FA2E2FC
VDTLDKADVIENYASGVRRIFEDYAHFKKQPEYYISDNGVIVTLFNRNYDGQNDGQKLSAEQRKEKIMELIKSNNEITIDMIKCIINVSKRTIERDIEKLRNNNKIEYIGSAKDGHWVVKEQG